MEAIEEGSEHASPAQLLTPQQRAVLLSYGQVGSVEAAGRQLGISAQTVKNHLSDAYRRLGVARGHQALYVLMGGDKAARSVPEASNDIRGLRRRVEVLERQLGDAENALKASNALGDARLAAETPPSDPLYLALMDDGHISLEELRAWSARFDADAGSTADMRISCREWVRLLAYYVRKTGSGMVDPAPG